MSAIRVLCVDDEPAVLAGLARTLRRDFSVDVATSGVDALVMLEADADYSIIVSDMMMPGMNGAELLSRSREIAPEVVRVLLTGHADAMLAAAAVNEGAISRYLSKPCDSERLITTLRECATMREQRRIERDVLSRTLTASVAALSQTLALVAPDVFARTARAQSIMAELIGALEADDRWAVEVAVPLSQIGVVALRENLGASWSDGSSFCSLDTSILSRIAAISSSIVNSIPRLERTAEIIRHGMIDHAPREDTMPGAVLLWSAFEVDALESRGMSRRDAAASLAARLHPAHATLIAPLLGAPTDRPVVRVSLLGLEVGMVLAQDVVNDAGVLLVGRGGTVTVAVLGRLQSFALSNNCQFIHVFGGPDATA
jgi:response regulator RpfG family c-di-GMP phosphodiesterase